MKSALRFVGRYRHYRKMQLHRECSSCSRYRLDISAACQHRPPNLETMLNVFTSLQIMTCAKLPSPSNTTTTSARILQYICRDWPAYSGVAVDCRNVLFGSKLLVEELIRSKNESHGKIEGIDALCKDLRKSPILLSIVGRRGGRQVRGMPGG